MKIIVLGGRGFLGKSVCAKLTKCTVFTFDRHQGGLNHFQGTINNPVDLKIAFKDMDVVINLIGLTPERTPCETTYVKVHVDGVKNIIKICNICKVKRLIHISAMGADKYSNIEYLRTKGLAEEFIRKSRIRANILRPGLIFDKPGMLVDRISKMAFTRVFPQIKATMQPIYRGDIARLISQAVYGKIKEQTLDIGGSEKMTVFDIAKKIYNKKGYACHPIPEFLVRLPLKIVAYLGLKGIGQDQVKLLRFNFTTNSGALENYIKPLKFDNWLEKIEI
jgi:uncharacterized protein YbjT (DUF2867 family)